MVCCAVNDKMVVDDDDDDELCVCVRVLICANISKGNNVNGTINFHLVYRW